MKEVKLMFIILYTFSFSFPSFGQDLYQTYLDSSTHKPTIVFTARGKGKSSYAGEKSLTGHSFVAVGEELDNGLLFEKAVFGFYPKQGEDKILQTILGTEGQINFRWNDLHRDVWFKKTISNSQYDSIMSILENWKSNQYTLLENNCNKLIKEIAIAAGLKVPSDCTSSEPFGQLAS